MWGLKLSNARGTVSCIRLSTVPTIFSSRFWKFTYLISADELNIAITVMVCLVFLSFQRAVKLNSLANLCSKLRCIFCWEALKGERERPPPPSFHLISYFMDTQSLLFRSNVHCPIPFTLPSSEWRPCGAYYHT